MSADELPPDEPLDDVPPLDAEVVPIEEAKKLKGQRRRYEWIDRLIRTKGKPKAILANVVLILANAPEWLDLLYFDELAQQVLTTRAPAWDPDEMPARCTKGPWLEADDARLACWLSRHMGFTVSSALAREAVDVVARKVIVHPVRDYLTGITWDGVARVHEWTTTYLGVRRNRYSEAAGMSFLISAVARAFQPGCKVDTMPILEGPQGAFKSTAVRVLFGAPFVSDTPIDFQDKDRFVALRGRWCVEMAELDGLDKADINRVKGYLSSAFDDYRPPYGRYMQRFPRQCVFFGTVNGSDYLRDPTGGRRFWPLRVGFVDIAALERDRDQLWAEARSMYEDGKPWWPSANLAADFEAQQSKRTKADEWTPLVARWVGVRDFVTIGEVLEYVFGLEPTKWTQGDQNRVAACLQTLGYERAQRRLTRGGARVRGYARPGSDDPEEEEATRAPE